MLAFAQACASLRVANAPRQRVEKGPQPVVGCHLLWPLCENPTKGTRTEKYLTGVEVLDMPKPYPGFRGTARTIFDPTKRKNPTLRTRVGFHVKRSRR